MKRVHVFTLRDTPSLSKTLSVCLILYNPLPFCDLSVYISPTCCYVCLCACQSHALPLFILHFICPLPFLKRKIQRQLTSL